MKIMPGIAGTVLVGVCLTGCAEIRRDTAVRPTGDETSRVAGDQARRSSFEDLNFPEIEVRGLVATAMSDGRWELAGVVVNTERASLPDPHEVELYIQFFRDEGKRDLVWTTPTFKYRVDGSNAWTIDESGRSEQVRTFFDQLNYATCHVRKLD